MKEKNLNISTLLDYYGDVLTEKQRDLAELYYNEDLSLGEISELENISRQGVRDSIKRGESILFELEDKLGMAKKMQELSESLDSISKLADYILTEGSSDLKSYFIKIKTIADKAQEKI